MWGGEGGREEAKALWSRIMVGFERDELRALRLFSLQPEDSWKWFFSSSSWNPLPRVAPRTRTLMYENTILWWHSTIFNQTFYDTIKIVDAEGGKKSGLWFIGSETRKFSLLGRFGWFSWRVRVEKLFTSLQTNWLCLNMAMECFMLLYVATWSHKVGFKYANDVSTSDNGMFRYIINLTAGLSRRQRSSKGFRQVISYVWRKFMKCSKIKTIYWLASADR